ncbi:LysR substrate-binding domain-containing protein [Bdellovibrio sp. HCB337]|uniref:LysR family transcriptional regulator n=1 Tax=Bdellovibrio sp. HCB337 TaxID=3394358 RepID=UPI0039A72938
MNLDLTRIFVKVVQNGSFSKAADLLNLPKSTISKAVSRLEKESGTKLIVRTTRSLSLTAAGRVFYETSLGPIQILEDAQKSLNGGDSLLSGLVKITAPEDLGTYVIAPAVAKLTQRHPRLSFELKYTNELIDLVKDGFDIAIRIGRPNESSFKVKRAGDVILIAVATPKYLSNKEKIRSPKDLEKHDCLSLSSQHFRKWKLTSTKGGTAHVPVNNRISSNQMSSILKMVLADGGVALVPNYLCENDLESGKIVRVLPEWRSMGLPVSMISPLSSSSSARLKMTMDYLLEDLQSVLKSQK